jgi:hypothetical protein
MQSKPKVVIKSFNSHLLMYMWYGMHELKKVVSERARKYIFPHTNGYTVHRVFSQKTIIIIFIGDACTAAESHNHK